MSSPLAYYQSQIAAQAVMPDPAQQQAILRLQNLYERFLSRPVGYRRVWQAIKHSLGRPVQPIKGLYLWGEVGAGKTWLMDIFYHALAPERKKRLHFHQFMQQIHQSLRTLQGQRNPLSLIAKQLAKEIDILCFDEFCVTDIADAMILSGLLQALFAQKIILVATSNMPPEELYRHGLQRALFLPAIALLAQHTEVVAVHAARDYRLRLLQQAGTYFSPLGEQAEGKMQALFTQFTRGATVTTAPLVIQGRSIPVLAAAPGAVWFDFGVLCNVPRSQVDYLEIAQLYPTVFLSNLPQILPEQEQLICYLINLVDVFYDNAVKLVLSAAVPIAALYPAGRFSFQFKRTKSRLLEMQSVEYCKIPHLRL